jgi:hypothetical protein
MIQSPTTGTAKVKIEVRSSRTVGLIAFVIGGLGLALAAVWGPLRTPYPLFVFTIAVLVGAWRLLDRRVRLTVSDGGIRYADWGPTLIPWREFSGYAWTIWRNNPYLQLTPRRPSQLVERFSPLGKLNHHLGRIVGIPGFSIAVTPLEIPGSVLAAHIALFLPEVNFQTVS